MNSDSYNPRTSLELIQEMTVALILQELPTMKSTDYGPNPGSMHARTSRNTAMNLQKWNSGMQLKKAILKANSERNECEQQPD
jgi:hypothetical protein